MKRTILTTLALLPLLGCATQQQVDTLRNNEATAERVYAATTQATATARTAAATMPAAQSKEAMAIVTNAERVEQTARAALDVAQAALAAAQKQDPSDPALAQAVGAAVSLIPSPWTPLLASLIPAALPLAYSLIQSSKLNRAHQQVVAVTQQLQTHQATLATLTKPQPTRPDPGTPAAPAD